MLLMCSNRSMPTMEAAMPVVSDSGDILSPNSAPDTTAPATIAGLALNAGAMPINATPAVACKVDRKHTDATPSMPALQEIKKCGA